MKKLPAFALLALVLGMTYLSCSDPEILKPHNPRLTPSLTATETQPALATDLPTLKAAPTASATSTELPTVLPTPTRLGTRHPVPSVPPPSPSTHIIEVTQDDIDALARLCVIEVRGMNEVRSDACMGVVSTVMTRAYNRIISDGTVAGTIGWGCTAESDTCQFPAHVLASGCDGLLPEACAWNYPDDIVYFQRVVQDYFEGWGWGGLCTGYIYYGITEQDPPECHLESQSGQFLNWHGKVK